MNGPPSSGQVVSTGSLVRSGSRMTTSCTLPSRTVFGIALASGARRMSAPSFLDERRAGRRKFDAARARAPRPRRAIGVERHRHAALRTELIGQHRKLRAFDVGEEQRRTAGLDDAIGDLGNLEARIDLRGDLVEFAGFAQRIDEGAQ